MCQFLQSLNQKLILPSQSSVRLYKFSRSKIFVVFTDFARTAKKYTLECFTHVTGSCKVFMKRIIALFIAWISQPSYQILLALYQRRVPSSSIASGHTRKLEVCLKSKNGPQSLQEKRPLHKGFCRT